MQSRTADAKTFPVLEAIRATGALEHVRRRAAEEAALARNALAGLKPSKYRDALRTIDKAFAVEQESLIFRPTCRSVAQPGRALRSGRRGRMFESCHSDQRHEGPGESGLSFWLAPGGTQTTPWDSTQAQRALRVSPRMAAMRWEIAFGSPVIGQAADVLRPDLLELPGFGGQLRR